MKNKPRIWNVKNALVQMHGMEHACRLLLADLDRELVDRDSFSVKSGRLIGIGASATVLCAWYCELALKTFCMLNQNDEPAMGHDLLELYKKIELHNGSLEDDIVETLKRDRVHIPHAWIPRNVRDTLAVARGNFNDWRYGFPENEGLDNGIPKGVFAIAKGLEEIMRLHYLKKHPHESG